MNIPVTISNLGHSSFSLQITGQATTTTGSSYPVVAAQDVEYKGPGGRAPDWTAVHQPSITPGSVATQYLTFAIPDGVAVSRFVVDPSLLIGNTQYALDPIKVTYFPAGGAR